jgi:hypothetical protein
MTCNNTAAMNLKYELIKRHYGLEELMDLPETVPATLSKLDDCKTELDFIRELTKLDFWYIEVTCTETGDVWNPLDERLDAYLKHHSGVLARMFAEKRVSKAKVIRFYRKFTNVQ